MKQISVTSPAKINLTLDIISKRDDGYHELEMVMQEISLKDKIVLKETEKDLIKITSNSKEIPLDEKNLVWKAIQLVKEKKMIKKGIEAFIEKKIPVAGGMGGGSSNAAATIKGLNKLWELEMKEKEMQLIAESLGMDVTFFLHGGTCFASGRGEKIEGIKSFPKTRILICNPGIHVSTKKAYSEINYEKTGKVLASRKMKKAIEEKKITEELAELIHNDFEFSVFNAFPKIKELKEKMKPDSFNALMSGSGSTVFCFPKTEKQSEELALKLKKEFKTVIQAFTA
ncbi:MAG: 4-(cytidine 5'-diphospho)-2-C-methyl-D-erythritol kinase [archaeon]